MGPPRVASQSSYFPHFLQALLFASCYRDFFPFTTKIHHTISTYEQHGCKDLNKMEIPQGSNESESVSASPIEDSTLTDAPEDTIQDDVYIPTSLPPYESPLDLRYPMHFDHIAQKEIPQRCETGALREAIDTAANELFERHGIFLQIFFAWNMSHYPGGTSPPFFEVDLSPDLVTLDYGKEIHGTVLQTIER